MSHRPKKRLGHTHAADIVDYLRDLGKQATKAAAPTIATAILALHFSGHVSATPACDTSLLTDNENPLSYQERKGRCEGIYIEQVAGTALFPVSLEARFDDFDANRDQTVFLSWPRTETGNVTIRATALAWDLPYRLDAVRAANDMPFRWPTNVLDALDLGRHDIGILAWLANEDGERPYRVLLPLTLTRDPTQSEESSEYRLVIVPGVPLQEVFLSIASTQTDGLPEHFLLDGKPLAYGYYPANQALEIPLSGFTAAGRYYVELGARLRDGRSSTLSFVMQHGGN